MYYYIYEPEEINNDIAPNTLYIMIHNNHSYRLNEHCCFIIKKQLKNKINSREWNDVDLLTVSEKYKVREPINTNDVYYIHSLDDCLKIAKETKNSENKLYWSIIFLLEPEC